PAVDVARTLSRVIRGHDSHESGFDVTIYRRLASRGSGLLSDARAIVLHRHAVRVVVLGHQKSGTTAIASLLAKMVRRDYANDPLYSVDRGRAELVERTMRTPNSLGS